MKIKVSFTILLILLFAVSCGSKESKQSPADTVHKIQQDEGSPRLDHFSDLTEDEKIESIQKLDPFLERDEEKAREKVSKLFLIVMDQDERLNVRREALWYGGRYLNGEEVEKLKTLIDPKKTREAIEQRDWDQRLFIAGAIRAIGYGKREKSFQFLYSLLFQEEFNSYKYDICLALRHFPTLVLEKMPELMKLFKKSDENSSSLKEGIVYIIGRLDENAKPYLPILVETYFLSKKTFLKEEIARSFYEVSFHTHEHIYFILQMLKDKTSSKIRLYAALALGRWGEDAVPAIPQLINALSDSDSFVQDAAAEALKKMGLAIVPKLKELKKDMPNLEEQRRLDDIIQELQRNEQ